MNTSSNTSASTASNSGANNRVSSKVLTANLLKCIAPTPENPRGYPSFDMHLVSSYTNNQIIYCGEETHLYYFCHFVRDLVTRICYLVTCSILISLTSILSISIIYIVFVFAFFMLREQVYIYVILCNVHILCLVIYLSTQLLFIFNIIFVLH